MAVFSVVALLQLVVVWDDVVFDTDCIRIRPQRIKQIVQPIPFKGAVLSLNAIKAEYFQTKYNKPFKLVFVDSVLNKGASPAWAELNELIEKVIEISRFAALPKTIKRKAAVRVKKESLAAAPKKEAVEKPGYLKALARLQSGKYKLITIQEKYGGKCEESHIYRFQSGSGRILIVWENTNASRAAYLFIATEETMTDRLSRIEAFINAEGLLFKRSRFQRLKENKSLRAELHFIGSVHHESHGQFETDIRTFINRY